MSIDTNVALDGASRSRVENALGDRREAITKSRYLTFKPNPPQWDAIEHDDRRILAIIGGNKSGKTTYIVTEGISCAIGQRLYLPEKHRKRKVLMPNGRPIRVPNVGQVVAEDYPNGIAKVQWPTWKAFLPEGSYRIDKTERGVVREISIDVSWCPWADRRSPLYPWSKIYFMAYEQGPEKFAGFDPDWIANDEPPPRDIFIEEYRGLVPTGGKWMGAMTLVNLNQAWIYDMFFPPKKFDERAKEDAKAKEAQKVLGGCTRHVVTATMYDNLKRDDGSGGLTIENIRAFEEPLTPEERMVRIHGQRIHMVGTEFSGIWNEGIHIVPHRAPNPDSAFVMACDAHPTKAYGILFAEINDHDEIYVWAESYNDALKTLTSISDEIKEIEGWQRRVLPGEKEASYIPFSSPFQAHMRLIDPLAKTPERGGMGINPVQQFAAYHGLYFAAWKKANKENRIKNVKEKMGVVRGKSLLSVSERCQELLYEIPRYRERLPQNPETQERKGEMMKVLDDLIDPLIAICNIQYPARYIKAIGRVRHDDGMVEARDWKRSVLSTEGRVTQKARRSAWSGL